MSPTRSAATLAWGAALLLSAPSVVASEGEGARPAEPRAAARFLMGTRLSIEVEGPADPGAVQAAFEEVERLEAILSNWNPESEVSRLNERAGLAWVRCSPDLFRAVEAAIHWAAETEGAFDPTVEPLVRALGLRGAAGVSAPEAVERLPIGWRHVQRRDRSRTVRYASPGVALDFGGIGKGIALDAAARVLARHRVRAALLDFGGQVLAMGRPRGSAGWPVGIADPSDRDVAVEVIPGADVSISTSGNGERAVAGPDGPIGHILDPDSQRPATFEGSVTVVAVDGTSADALSTALFVMGPEAGIPWADRRLVAALYLWRNADGTLGRRATRAFDQGFPRGSGAFLHGGLTTPGRSVVRWPVIRRTKEAS